jgi:hypothetical protein
MIRDHFRILTVNLATGKGKVVTLDGRDTEAGGSGLAACCLTNMVTQKSLGTTRSSLSFSPSVRLPAISLS